MKPRRLPRNLPPRQAKQRLGKHCREIMPARPAGHTLAEFQPLLPAEQQLLQACRTGEVAVIGDGLPEEPTPENRVRASFLRFLALGGDAEAPIHEHGVQFQGAWIDGVFDAEGANIPGNLTLWDCYFELAPVFRDARIEGTLNLSGSQIPGLKGDRLRCVGGIFLRGSHFADEVRLHGARIGDDIDCQDASFDSKDGNALSMDGAQITGNVFLNNDFSALGPVRLLGASIGGDLACRSANFHGRDGDALSMDRAQITGTVFLDNGFSAKGKVRLLGANIGGNLDCGSASLDDKDDYALSMDQAQIAGNVFLRSGFSAKGQVRLNGSGIGGNLDCTGASFDGKKIRSLSADGLRVEGAFFLRNLKTPLQNASFASTHVGILIDDPESWDNGQILDGFIYDAISGSAPTDAQTRLSWLSKQHETHYGHASDYKPQPWQQLIKVLRTMGHLEDARQVAIAREEHLHKIGKIGETPAQWSKPRAWIYRTLARSLHSIFGLLIGYGFRPLRMVLLMLLVWLASGAFFWFAAVEGVMAPSNPLVFNHPAYAHCRPDYEPLLLGPPKVGNWYLCPDLAGEYTTFSPLAYSLDLILPLVNLQQESDWAPIVPTPKATWYAEFAHLSLNHLARFAVWFEILFGWVGSLLLVAVLSGLTQRDKD